MKKHMTRIKPAIAAIAALMLAGIGTAPISDASFIPGLPPMPPVALPTGLPQYRIDTIRDDALVGFDDNGTAFVDNPAFAPLATAGFNVAVFDFPHNSDVASVRIEAAGIAAFANTTPVSYFDASAAAEGFTVYPHVNLHVPFTVEGEYMLQLVSGNGTVLHANGPLKLLSSDPVESGVVWLKVPEAGAEPAQWQETQNARPLIHVGYDAELIEAIQQQGQGYVTAAFATVNTIPPYLNEVLNWNPLGGDTPPLPTGNETDGGGGGGNCNGPARTYALETLDPYYGTNYGDVLSSDHERMTSEAWTNEWTYGYYTGNCGTELDSDLRFGLATDISGPSELVGLGIRGYTYTVDYRGTREMYNTCRGGSCQMVGHAVGASKGEVFVKTPSPNVAPTYLGVSNVKVPGSGPTEWYVKFAMEQIKDAIQTWGGWPGAILAFGVPENFDGASAYSTITTNGHGSPGGGLRSNLQVYNEQKVVGGQMDWKYEARGDFSYDMHNTVTEDVVIRACYGCNVIERHTTWATSISHQGTVL